MAPTTNGSRNARKRTAPTDGDETVNGRPEKKSKNSSKSGGRPKTKGGKAVPSKTATTPDEPEEDDDTIEVLDVDADDDEVMSNPNHDGEERSEAEDSDENELSNQSIIFKKK
jgi:hypothetical protein